MHLFLVMRNHMEITFLEPVLISISTFRSIALVMGMCV